MELEEKKQRRNIVEQLRDIGGLPSQDMLDNGDSIVILSVAKDLPRQSLRALG